MHVPLTFAMQPTAHISGCNAAGVSPESVGCVVWEVVPRLAWPVGANARTGGFSVVRLRWRVGGFEGDRNNGWEREIGMNILF